MEMCYDGILMMPNSYAVMDDQEMTYVDGGISYSQNWFGTTFTFTSTECRAIALILGGIATSAAVFSAYMGCIAVGAAVPTFGLSLATAGVIAAFSALAGAITGAGSWYFSNFNKITIPGFFLR